MRREIEVMKKSENGVDKMAKIRKTYREKLVRGEERV